MARTIKPNNEKTEPVKLLAIPFNMLPPELVIAGNAKKNDNHLIVFTGAVHSAAKNIFYSHQGILRNAGYEQQDRAIKVLFPQVHEIKGRRSDNRNFATAQIVSAAEIKKKFPGAKITLVNSVDELVKEYQSLVAERKETIGVSSRGR